MTLFGMSLLKVRGSTGESNLYRALRMITDFNCCCARGASFRLSWAVTAVASKPNASAGQSIRQVLTPAARIATNSLSLPIRPSPMIVPDKTAMGMVNTRTVRSEEHTSELQSLAYLVCRLLLEK